MMIAATAPAGSLVPWSAIGTEPIGGDVLRYLFNTASGTRAYRGSYLASVATLGEIDPDMARWRAMFPSAGRHGVDVASAAAFLMAQCHAAQARRDSQQST